MHGSRSGYWSSGGNRLLWLALALPAGWFLGPGFLADLHPPADRITDFFQEWASARSYLDGLPIYGRQQEAAQRYLGVSPVNDRDFVEVNGHPPSAVLLALPFGLLPYPQAFLAWTLLSLAAFAGSAWLVVRLLAIPLSPWALLPTLTLLLACHPFRQQMSQGQPNLFLLLLLTGAWAADRSERPRLAGALVGIAAAIKLFPAFILLYFVLRREWRALTAALLTLAGLTLLTAAILGSESFTTFATDVVPRVRAWRSNWNNASLPGLWSKLFDPGTKGSHVQPVRLDPALAQLGTALSCMVLLAAWAAGVREATTLAGRDRAFAASVLAMLLVAPVTWEHYFVLLLVPLAVLWLRLPARGPTRWLFHLCLVALWLAPFVYYFLLMHARVQDRHTQVATPGQTLTALSVQLYALLALFLLTLRLGDAGTRPPERRELLVDGAGSAAAE